MVTLCCGQVGVPSVVGDHAAAQFLVRWHKCKLACLPACPRMGAHVLHSAAAIALVQHLVACLALLCENGLLVLGVGEPDDSVRVRMHALTSLFVTRRCTS